MNLLLAVGTQLFLIADLEPALRNIRGRGGVGGRAQASFENEAPSCKHAHLWMGHMQNRSSFQMVHHGLLPLPQSAVITSCGEWYRAFALLWSLACMLASLGPFLHQQTNEFLTLSSHSLLLQN